MAGASMNDIKSRIKSVGTTMQITKAMELVATSKLRRAKERAERGRPYRLVMNEAISSLLSSSEMRSTPWCRVDAGKTLYIVIAGDRGLAGGYNQNIFRLVSAHSKNENAIILPIGRKAVEYYKNRKAEIFSLSLHTVASLGVGSCINAAEEICRAFSSGEISSVKLIYTHFKSMISSVPTCEELLPLQRENTKDASGEPILEAEEIEEILASIIPGYIGGLIYAAVSDAIASECASRRNAMNSANKNAEEMIDSLMLKYNRARQSVITQEITEIVSGAEALG